MSRTGQVIFFTILSAVGLLALIIGMRMPAASYDPVGGAGIVSGAGALVTFLGMTCAILALWRPEPPAPGVMTLRDYGLAALLIVVPAAFSVAVVVAWAPTVLILFTSYVIVSALVLTHQRRQTRFWFDLSIAVVSGAVLVLAVDAGLGHLMGVPLP